MTYKSKTEYGYFHAYSNNYQGATLQKVPIRYITISGTNTPNFRTVKKKNLPVNDVTVTEIIWKVGNLKTHRVVWLSPLQVVVNTEVFSPAYNPCPYNALSQAASRFRLKLKTMDVNLAQAFGERMQTVNMLASTALRLRTAFSALRHGNLGSAFGALNLSYGQFNTRNPKSIPRYWKTFKEDDPYKAAASLWLELQYGWRPLLSDVYGSAKTLAEYNVRRDTDFFERYHTHSAFVNVQDSKDTIQGVPTDYTRTLIEFNAMGMYKVTYRISNPLLRYSSLVGMSNPALLAWELTPFSFVVDWFLPIGNYLNSIDAAYGLSFHKGASYDKRYSSTSVTRFLDNSKTAAMWVKSQNNGGTTEHKYFKRSPLLSFPSNPLPRFKSPLSYERAANAVALLLVTFRK